MLLGHPQDGLWRASRSTSGMGPNTYMQIRCNPFVIAQNGHFHARNPLCNICMLVLFGVPF